MDRRDNYLCTRCGAPFGKCGCNSGCYCCSGPQGPQGIPGPVGPQGPIGSFAMAFGGLFNETAPVYTLLPDGVPQILSMDEAMPALNTTLGVNTVTINVTGIYKVDFFAVLESATGDTIDLLLGVQVNGVFNRPSIHTSLPLRPEFELISMSGIVNLTQGDVLTLAMSSLAGGDVLLGPGTSASFSAMLLHI